jgi:hypothetical protein
MFTMVWLHGPSKLCPIRLAVLCPRSKGRPTFRKYWPDAKTVHAAIIRELIGISIPFVFVYAYAGVISGRIHRRAKELVGGRHSFCRLFGSLPDGLLASACELVPASSEGVKCNRSALIVVIANRTGRPLVSISTNNGPCQSRRVARTSVNFEVGHLPGITSLTCGLIPWTSELPVDEALIELERSENMCAERFSTAVRCGGGRDYGKSETVGSDYRQAGSWLTARL